jgi:hypothetical protein
MIHVFTPLNRDRFASFLNAGHPSHSAMPTTMYPPPQVMQVVGKRTDGMQHVQRIPTGLELQPFPFHGFAVQEHSHGYRQFHWHPLAVSPFSMAARNLSIAG